MSAFNFEQARYNMIQQQIRPWEVLDPKVLDTLTAIPREDFVPERYRHLAFADVAIPLACGQTMLKPTIEGRLLQALAVKPDDHVLVVGTGSGYITACLAHLATNVVSVDIVPELIEAARLKLKAHGIKNTILHVGDALQGWGEHQYDVIAITGSVATLYDVWRQSLKPGGRLFVVIGQAPVMEAQLITRLSEQEWINEELFETYLPPLHGAEPVKSFKF
ncbi:MAG: protein-L-isoaspartate O-methyltransferase [Candidatus Contendobacter odensis]|uniref:Protein-L-isoaspartate O-methyltransferase n=1 Tax=Candidatus Contendibacter odensensis TaxID=1400860 RepID=A0A2G6PEI0_9GAMM|nr:MAG: protein-L-isoaspartate O-methyltransferase [Candidatus Contendobacter odensis]